MTGGYHAAEQTLFEAGKWHEVRQARMSWQDTMQARFVETIERLTRREVKAFMSANHQSPDVTVELFVLERDDTAPDASRRRDYAPAALRWGLWLTRSTTTKAPAAAVFLIRSPQAPRGGRRG